MVSKEFAAAGFVWECRLPRNEKAQSRGFCFVAFARRDEAEKAIKLFTGGTILGRPVAVDWAVAKDRFESAAAGAAAAEEEAPEADAGPSGAGGDEEGDELPRVRRRAAFPFSSAQSLAPPLRLPLACTGPNSTPPEHPDATVHLPIASDPPPASFLRQGSKGKEGAPAADTDAPANGEAEAPKKKRRVGDPAATVVLHGVPPEATDVQLRAAVVSFGRPRHLSFATDKLSGRRTGVAFVEFFAREPAAALVTAAAAKTVVLAGCRVKARSLDTAPPDLSAANAKVDKRNLYLAREGEVPLGSPAATGVSDADMEKRQQAAAEKAEKLRNPNYHVSATRLFFRNLPASADEKRLRKLCAGAVEQRTGRSPEILRVNVMRDAARLDKAGNPKSRGSAYVELGNHADALATLRAVNNNPLVFNKEKRPIVEFALEDVRQKYKRDVKLVARRRGERDRAAGEEGGGAAEEEPEAREPWKDKGKGKGKGGKEAGKGGAGKGPPTSGREGGGNDGDDGGARRPGKAGLKRKAGGGARAEGKSDKRTGGPGGEGGGGRKKGTAAAGGKKKQR